MKILIICLPGIGDTLLYTPALKKLRNTYPDSQIDFLVMFKSAAQLLEKNPNLNQVYFWDFIKKGIMKSLVFLFKLRKMKYDLSILAYPSNRMEYNLIQYLIGAKRRLAHRYLHKNLSSLSFLNTDTIIENNELHNVEENIALINRFDHAIEIQSEEKLELVLAEEDTDFAKQWLKQRQIQERLLIGIHAGTAVFKNHIKRRWAPEKFAELSNRLIQEKNAVVLIFGGPDEEPLKKEIADQIQGDCYIVSDTSIRESAALIQECSVFISNDSALMHCAAAMGTPCVSIFGPTNTKWVYPFRTKYEIVSLNLDCSPCFFYSKIPLTCYAKKDFACIKNITVELALEKVDQILKTVD